MFLMHKPVTRKWWRSCCWLSCVWTLLSLPCDAASPLVTSQRAGRYGLERAWFGQVAVDAARSRISHWTLHRNQLFSLSTSGTLQSLDAETGETLWTARIGTPGGVFAGPSVNSEVVALTSGTRLYVLDRSDGHVLWSRSLGGATAAAPALSETYAFVGLMNGILEGYPLKDLKASVWQHRSVGRIFHSPTSTGDVVSWPTDRGYLYVAQAIQPRVLFRVETNDEIVAPPAEWDPYFYVTSRDGYLYCVHERSGADLWRVATGYPIISKPVAVDDVVFVASEQPALHAVQAQNGRRLWSTDGATQFAALGAKQVYAMDRLGGLLILDKDSGGVVGRLAVGERSKALVNDQSDRIFLVNDAGLVQCLRERGSKEPTFYRQRMEDETAPTAEEAEESPFVEETPAEDVSPPEAPDRPVERPAPPAQPEDDEEEDDEEEEPQFFF